MAERMFVASPGCHSDCQIPCLHPLGCVPVHQLSPLLRCYFLGHVSLLLLDDLGSFVRTVFMPRLSNRQQLYHWAI